MTGYNKSLIEYIKWYGGMSDEEAAKWCDKNLAATWRMHSEQPEATALIVSDNDDRA